MAGGCPTTARKEGRPDQTAYGNPEMEVVT